MNTKFDFLANLFKTNEKAFNEYHAEVIDDYINTLPHDRANKMREFQHVIVNEMNKCETMEDRNQRMNDLFWEQTQTFGKAFDALNKVISATGD